MKRKIISFIAITAMALSCTTSTLFACELCEAQARAEAEQAQQIEESGMTALEYFNAQVGDNSLRDPEMYNILTDTPYIMRPSWFKYPDEMQAGLTEISNAIDNTLSSDNVCVKIIKKSSQNKDSADVSEYISKDGKEYCSASYNSKYWIENGYLSTYDGFTKADGTHIATISRLDRENVNNPKSIMSSEIYNLCAMPAEIGNGLIKSGNTYATPDNTLKAVIENDKISSIEYKGLYGEYELVVSNADNAIIPDKSKYLDGIEAYEETSKPAIDFNEYLDTLRLSNSSERGKGFNVDVKGTVTVGDDKYDIQADLDANSDIDEHTGRELETCVLYNTNNREYSARYNINKNGTESKIETGVALKLKPEENVPYDYYDTYVYYKSGEDYKVEFIDPTLADDYHRPFDNILVFGNCNLPLLRGLISIQPNIAFTYKSSGQPVDASYKYYKELVAFYYGSKVLGDEYRNDSTRCSEFAVTYPTLKQFGLIDSIGATQEQMAEIIADEHYGVPVEVTLEAIQDIRKNINVEYSGIFKNDAGVFTFSSDDSRIKNEEFCKLLGVADIKLDSSTMKTIPTFDNDELKAISYGVTASGTTSDDKGFIKPITINYTFTKQFKLNNTVIADIDVSNAVNDYSVSKYITENGLFGAVSK